MSGEGERVVELLTQIRDLLAHPPPREPSSSAPSPADDDGDRTQIVRGD